MSSQHVAVIAEHPHARGVLPSLSGQWLGGLGNDGSTPHLRRNVLTFCEVRK